MRISGAIVLVMAALALSPGVATAASVDHVTMYSDGDYIGGGTQRFYSPANGRIAVGGSTSYLSVAVSGGTLGDSYTLEFAAPPGEVLVPGVYDRAQRAAFREAGRPGIDIHGDGRGCNEITGRFEVKDLAMRPDGILQRLWIIYEHHCEGSPTALFGEVRLGEPGPPGPVATAPSLVRWPVLDAGAAGAAVPVAVLAGSPAQLGTASLVGADASRFEIRLDECSQRALAAGGSCEVWVRFRPTAPGTHTAVLRLPEGGRVHEVELQGFAYGGRTRVQMVSDPGDYIGQGQTWEYTPANAMIAVRASRQSVSFRLDGVAGDWWYADFVAGRGDILVPGATYRATRYPFNGTGPGMDVDGVGRGCNTLTGEFTVTDLRFEPDGRLRGVGVRFEQHCEGSPPALRGTWEYRAGDTTPLPPWMFSGPGSVWPGVSPDSVGPPPPSAPVSGGGSGGAPGGSSPRACAGLLVRRGTARADRLRGGARGERILAGAGADRIRAGAGADCVSGGHGGDRLFGGPGWDRLFGGAGADVLSGAGGRDLLVGGSRRDVLRGQGGTDALIGGRGRDRLDCGPGPRDVARGVQRGEALAGCERVARVRASRR